MLKNATPRQLAFYGALIISVGYTIFNSILNLSFELYDSWYIPVIQGGGVFLLGYITFFFALKIYILRKIKLIYKNIQRVKLKSKEKSSPIDMGVDVIDEVRNQVKIWAEDQNREIAQLKEMENYRRNFVGNVSHELKTPIFTIQGYIHTLLEGGIYDENINMSFLRKAAKGVTRLQTIVEDLDTIAKLESNKIELEIEEFNIKDLVEDVFEDLDLLAKEKNIRLIFKEGTDKNFRVEADRESIRQVMTNLLANAIKYNNEKGQAKVSFYDMSTNILIEVADDGIGIDEKHLPHLFDRFYRVDASRSRSEGGSGLGLAIVKHIIEAHRQTIHARSRKGLGSTFGFTLKKVG